MSPPAIQWPQRGLLGTPNLATHYSCNRKVVEQISVVVGKPPIAAIGETTVCLLLVMFLNTGKLPVVTLLFPPPIVGKEISLSTL